MSARRLLAVLAFALVPVMALSQATAQQAPRVAVQDARDGQPLLDLREVDSAFEQGSVRFTFLTWGRWRSGALQDRAFLIADLDPQTGARYRVVVRSTGRRLVAVLQRKDSGRDKRLRRVRVWRRDRASVSVRIPAEALGLAAPGRYAWRAQALVTGRRCPRVCFDRAPEAGDALVEIPAPVPAAP